MTLPAFPSELDGDSITPGVDACSLGFLFPLVILWRWLDVIGLRHIQSNETILSKPRQSRREQVHAQHKNSSPWEDEYMHNAKMFYCQKNSCNSVKGFVQVTDEQNEDNLIMVFHHVLLNKVNFWK